VEEQLAQLETRLELAKLKPADAVPLIAPLLNLPLPAKYPPSPLSPEQQRRRLLATLVEWALGVAGAQATMIVIEDLHWADPSTLELLQLLVEQGTAARLLLLFTARPEFHAQWPPRTHHTQITLNRLSACNVRRACFETPAYSADLDYPVKLERPLNTLERLCSAILDHEQPGDQPMRIRAYQYRARSGGRLHSSGDIRRVAEYIAVFAGTCADHHRA
jgi:hypothetical protein